MRILALVTLLIAIVGCDGSMGSVETTSSTGVNRMIASIPKDEHGNTLEQANVATKLTAENRIGGLQYLYLISPFSGEVIYQSVAVGKVTSSGKRLTPKTVWMGGTHGWSYEGIPVDINGNKYYTTEVMGGDGTYGDSSEYLYWTDTGGNFHRQYVTAGAIIHVSSKPERFGHVTITTEQSIENK